MANQPSNNIIQLEDGWNNNIQKLAIEVLEDMLDNGFETSFDATQYIHIYTTCYDMCTQRSPYNWSRDLYQRHGETIERYLRNKVLPALNDRSGQGGTILLKELKKRWTNHQIMNKWLKKFFTYLDRYYVKHHNLPTLEEAGLRGFKVEIYDNVKEKATTSIISLIDEEREGAIIDKALVKSIVDLYASMGMGSLDSYVSDLEQPLLEATRAYYARKREDWISRDSTPDYLVKAENALTEERARVVEYLNSSSEPKIRRVVEDEILQKVQSNLLEKEGSGCRVLLANDKSEDLQRMFNLFSRLESGLQPMATIVENFITSMGTACIDKRQARIDGGEKDKNDDPAFVKSLIDLHEKYLGVIRRDFSGHPLFQKALKNSFEEIVNNSDVGQFSNAELMSTFCDRVLKKGGDNLSETEVEQSLDRIVQLFSYLTDKDLFAEIYRNQLAKRLLNQRSKSDDAEKAMIAKLKMQCGTQFTSKMEGMLNDLAVGADQKAEFERMPQPDTNLSFSVQVLTTGFWPSYKSPEVELPDNMTKCTGVFEKWHDTKHQKRKLTWMYSLGNANVRGTFGKKSYDLQVTTLQAVVLHAFHEGKSYEFTELKKVLNLDDMTLKPLMHSLSCGKHELITKSPSSNKINSTDSFTANARFTCKMRKIRIPVASLDASHNKNRVEEDRSFAIEAAIVRIMKARKTLKHQQLISEVMAQLVFFRPKGQFIKKRIEALIDREYLERSSEQTSVYNYLA